MNRHILLSGQPNFRDLGGYPSKDGRRVKWGAVYRSGELSQLSASDIDTLGELGIKTVVDLRSPQEVSARGESRTPPGARVVPLPIASSEVFSKLIPMFLEGDFSRLPPDLLERVNRALVRNFGAQYGGLLRTLIDRANRPLVFHCTQGKDRAGFGAAMVLSALGVPWETVVEDYLLSNHFRREENDKLLAMIRDFASSKNGEEVELSNIEGLLYVKAASLEAAHTEIRALHGDVESFLIDGLGCRLEELERLRDELLE
ncbi:MAG: tyrosine-protein phosphatase [Myxococcales bacterium]|nr:tyrosine-protein phosphatase [Myxococcales bacterium]MDH3485002.1 tyrosine-protein phosphatase [Myxococcales bacterium]